MLADALRYAGQGRPVFPCEPAGKRPLVRRGLHDATTEHAAIERWWARWPEANIGLRTGAVSGLIVLDVDGDEGHESLRELEREHGELPRTASVVTPRGGAHYYLSHPGGNVPNSAGMLGPGLDVRGDGGYVVAPPSLGPQGRRYEPDERAPLAPTPLWLLKRLRRPENARSAVPPGEWVGIVRDGLPDGQRNHGLARLVGHLLARDVDVRLVAELAQLVNARNQPPLDGREVERIVESIAGRELRRRTREARR